MLKYTDYFDIDNKFIESLFDNSEYVWDSLSEIKQFCKNKIKPNLKGIIEYGYCLNQTIVLYENKFITDNISFTIEDVNKGKLIVKHKNKVLEGASIIFQGVSIFDENIFIGKNCVIEPGALIKGPCYIGNNTEVRQGAYIRGNVIVGDRCVVGHNTEIKNSVLLGDSKAGHFAYIGDSILGKVNLGAGTKLANLKITNSKVKISVGDKIYDTGLRKFGAILGDGVELGCNSVTSPGTIIGKNSLCYPNTTLKGVILNNTIIKPLCKLKKIERR